MFEQQPTACPLQCAAFQDAGQKWTVSLSRPSQVKTLQVTGRDNTGIRVPAQSKLPHLLDKQTHPTMLCPAIHRTLLKLLDG